MHADGHAVGIAYFGADIADQRAILLRNRVASRVRNVQHRGPGVDRRFEHLEQKRLIGASRILRVELDVIGVAFREFHCLNCHLQDCDSLLGESPSVFVIAEFAHDVNIGRTDPGMDSRPLCPRQSLAARMNVVGHRT